MKKLTLLGMALLLSVSAIQVQAQEIDYSTNTSTDVFDFAPWNNRALLKLFADAADAGLKYPTQEMFEQAGFNLDMEFSRSHVRPATIMEDANKNIVSDVYPTRRFWLNTPTSQGDMVGGYPSGDFHEEVFSMWQYVQLYGAWNHSILQAPGSWADAAHKNGSHMFSGIEFFESWGTTSSAYNNLITQKNSDGSYRYVDAFLNALRFMGLDGINYNFEDSGYSQSDVIGFHQALYKRAKEIGFDSFHIGLYTSASVLSSGTANALYGSNGNKTADLFLNYSGGGFTGATAMNTSVNAAEAAMGTADGLYAGVWISHLNNRGWDHLNNSDNIKKCGVCCWGEHKVSRLFQYAIGTSLIDLQTNYQTLLEKFFSGEYRTPLRRPDVSSYTSCGFRVSNETPIEEQLVSFPGIASYVPERTAIQGNLPFNTHFTLGNGDFYAYKGKKTLDAWYNMGQQDYVPTYRWLLYQKGTTTESTALNAAFTHKDAYIGGSALHLTSSATGSGTDVVLYRAKLNVTGSNPKVTVALKSGKEGTNASNLSVIVKKFNNNTWYETALGNLTGKEWQEKEVALNGISSGDVIEYIGLRVNGGVSDYSMLVGKLMLSDDRAAVTPAEIDAASIVGEIKGETNKSMSVKLTWEVNTTGFSPALIDYGMVYNDEVNIDHFEIFYKNGEDGLVSEIGRTSTWSAYVPNLKFTDDSDDPYIGIRSVSVDMKTFSPVVWIHLDRATSGNLPTASTSNYPATYLDTASDGYETALTNRFLAKVTTSGATKDLNYSRSTAVGDENYVFEEDHVLKIAQGQKVTLTINGYSTSDDIRYCIGKGYMDWDINYEFDATNDEMLFTVGSGDTGTEAIVTGYSTTINVPTDAAIGISRLRMVFSDAWFSHPGAAGATNKGFSIDFPVEITGTNTPREPDPGYKALRDTGVAEQPEGIEDGGTIDPDPDPNPNPNPNPDPTPTPDPTYQTPSGTIHSGRTTYVEHIYTENLTPNLDKEWSSAPSSVYQLVDQTITLEPGQSFNLHLDAYSAGPASSTQSYQDLRYTRAFIYTDWDRDGTFTQEQIYGVKSPQATDNPNNVLANYNTVMEINQALTVPASASLGGSRIRVIYHNAWEDLNNGANSTNIKEGMAYDIPVKVEDPTAIDETKAGSVSSFYPTVANDAIHFNNVEKAWLYTIDGQFIQFIDNNPESANVSDLAPGLYVVKMQNGQIIRSQKLIKE